jgi:hypothetical protein
MPAEVARWLAKSDFEEDAQKALTKYTGAALLGTEKGDIKELLGAAEGLRLWALLHPAQHPGLTRGCNEDAIRICTSRLVFTRIQ